MPQNDDKWHSQPIAEVARRLNVSLEDGLDLSEINLRQQKFGSNQVSIRKASGLLWCYSLNSSVSLLSIS